jgi:hypothetical protein
VPLGLALTLVAIRLYRRPEKLGWAALATVGAVLSVEQVIFPLPLVVWLVTPQSQRRRAALVCAAVGACALGSFLVWPGANPRLRAGLADRIVGLWANPQFYVGYPAVGLGVHSIPLAVWWAWPWSAGALALGAAAGAAAGRSLVLAHNPGPERRAWRLLLPVLPIIALTNLVVVLAVPQQGSPRVFTPTWLVVAIAAPLAAAAVSWHRPRCLGALGGVFAVGAALSMAFSVSVRLRNADFTERATAIVASRVSDGGREAVCGVARTVVQPAPRGAYAVHDFIYDWAAERALTHYTGRRATIVLAGDMWKHPCPAPGDVEAVIQFDELLAAARP